MPLIDQLLEWNAEVILGGDGRSLLLLQKEYPKLRSIELPSYHVRYTSGSNMVAATLLQMPGYLRAVKREHKALNALIDAEGIECVISDNRYGMWSDRIPCVFICHQISVIPPGIMHWTMPLVHKLHIHFIDRFDQTWIPDLEGPSNLSGILSHQYPLTESMRFIGPLSRFQGLGSREPDGNSHVLVILSGPEPQRTALEEKIISQARRLDREVIIVQGKTEMNEERTDGNIRLVSYMNAKQLGAAIQQATVVVARSGYSTVMDLSALGKKAVLIPTPGQTEQEYLAGQLARQGMAVVQPQHRLDLNAALVESGNIKGFPVAARNEKFKEVLSEFIGVKR
jgi:uncharacterized protein (TIGR00661 family)